MPNIFGASLLDILSQGGQFMAGRNQAQQAAVLAAEKRKEDSALAQALIGQRNAAAEQDRANAHRLMNPPPNLMDLQQTEGAASAYSKPEYSAAENASNTIAHLGLGKVDPTLVLNATQRRADQVASQKRAEDAAGRAEVGAARSVDAQDRATASSERVNENQQRAQQEDAAKGSAEVYAQQAHDHPESAPTLHNAAVLAIQQAHPLISQGAAVSIVNDAFTKYETEQKRLAPKSTTGIPGLDSLLSAGGGDAAPADPLGIR